MRQGPERRILRTPASAGTARSGLAGDQAGRQGASGMNA
ncbi:hypothetical protein LHGZ1_3227 [Laribacter hongkongensis]|uniref:Uncharacterized protein n=1 Tax=Laribacter hongkongensis TaxID=168471 RepID=A0A248LMU8_9NEIS|nr:hypothetical protein LHGZ1_3227 [Laribacter hongkongensis]